MKILLVLMCAILVASSTAMAQSGPLALTKPDAQIDRAMVNVGHKCGEYFYITLARLERDGRSHMMAFSDQPEIDTLFVIHHALTSWRVVIDNSGPGPTAQLADDSSIIVLRISYEDYLLSPCLQRYRNPPGYQLTYHEPR